jgi:hypothetical protein
MAQMGHNKVAGQRQIDCHILNPKLDAAQLSLQRKVLCYSASIQSEAASEEQTGSPLQLGQLVETQIVALCLEQWVQAFLTQPVAYHFALVK